MDVRSSAASQQRLQALAALVAEGSTTSTFYKIDLATNLYAINLSTGTAVLLGAIGSSAILETFAIAP